MSTPPPLSAAQLQEKRALAAAYTETWTHKRNSPQIPLAEVSPLFDKAAEIVARIRQQEREARHASTKPDNNNNNNNNNNTSDTSDCDSMLEDLNDAASSDTESDLSLPPTTIEGSATELLLTESFHPLVKQSAPLPISMESVAANAKAFVRRLVHATLQDAEGYVHDLSRDRVDALVDAFFDADVAAASGAADDAGRSLFAALALEWSTTQAYVRETLSAWRDDELLWHDYSPSKLEQNEAKALNELCGNAEWQQRVAVVRDALSTIRSEMAALTAMRSAAKQQVVLDLRASQDLSSPPHHFAIDDLDTMAAAVQEVDAIDADVAAAFTPIINDADEQPDNDADNDDNDDADQQATQSPADATPSVEMQVDAPPPSNDGDTAAADDNSDDLPILTVDAPAAVEPSESPSTATAADDSVPPSFGRQDLRSSTTKLEVQRVASDVERWEDRVHRLQKLYEDLNVDQLLTDPAEGKKILQRLHKNCLQYTGSLMLDLDALDRLSVSSSNTRQLRKQQINHIQQLLDNLESIKTKLVSMQGIVEKKLADEQPPAAVDAATPASPETQPQDDPAAAAAAADQQQQEQEQQTPTSDTSAERDSAESDAQKKRQRQLLFWRRLKLDPRFEVNETRDAYELLSMIPHMRIDDVSIKVSEDGETLTLSGFRGPSPQEEAEMARLIERQRREYQRLAHGRSPFWTAFEEPRQWDEQELLVRLGTGRFGSFVKTFELPRNGVDLAGISASYERGVLRVTIPKDQEFIAQQRLRKQQQQQQQQRRQRQQAYNPWAADPRAAFGFPANNRASDFWW